MPVFQWARIPGTATVRKSGQFVNFTGLRLGRGVKPDLEADYNETWYEGSQPPEISDFELTVYPVTVAQFRSFVQQGDYENNDYWSESGRRWRDKANRWTPDNWKDRERTLDNQPVSGISWYEAEAYCNWLNSQSSTNQAIRLPTEAEWEWAARGPEGRCYPWGEKWQTGCCNNNESGINRLIAVGCFPGGVADWWRLIWPDSEVAHDLAGNVSEWTASGYTADYAGAHQSVLNADFGGARVLRGGSRFVEPYRLRGAARFRGDPHDWTSYWGFRLARTLAL
jgi:formylglycine-generating enzyme required for sulfatase activity